jgi:hypothetical protein
MLEAGAGADRVNLQEWRRAIGGCGVVVAMLTMTMGCSGRLELQRLMEARQLSSDLLAQFSKASDASNRAVMADTEEKAGEFAHEAEQATQEVQRGSEQLKTLLADGYFAESRLLGEFNARFSEYHALDRMILALAVESTNLKAQRLSFGPVQKEADAFEEALDSVARSAAPTDTWRVKALVGTAVSAVREIQVLEAPHIVEPDDAEMTRIEARMAKSQQAAQSALEMLAGVVQPASRPQLSVARSALTRFNDLHAQVITLSRRNSNVRSLALSLGKKRVLTARCEESLHAIQDALSKRAFAGTR